MGCDIHLFIEHKHPEWTGWFAFGGMFRIDRDYPMFNRMAGVRGDVKNAISNPRGLPGDISFSVRDANRLYIDDEVIEGERTVKREIAQRWVDSGSSEYDGDNYVTDPDSHSHSWLTSDEFEQCINSFENVSNEYKAVLAALRTFEADGEETRVIFWFDN